MTAVGEGSAVITASSADGKFQAVCQVTVSTREIPVTGILLSDTVVYLLEGERWLLTASVTPTDATNQELLWSSGNHDVATVDNGVLVAEDTRLDVYYGNDGRWQLSGHVQCICGGGYG